MQHVMVTGVNGFVGRHVARELHQRGSAVIGIGHSGPAHPEIHQLLADYHQCDLTDEEAVAQLPLKNINAIINLAGLAKVGESFADPERYTITNVNVLNIISKKLLEVNPEARVIAVSTGAVYDANQPLPLREDSRLISEGSPYALSKILMEQAGQDLIRQGLKCAIVRPFNHIGPGQEPGFLLPDLYEKAMEAHRKGTVVKTGNLTTKRDYTDVRDITRAYADLALADNLKHDTYNVCSGQSLAGQALLDLLLQELKLENRITVEVDETLIRPSDPTELFGNYQRLYEETGWRPTIPIEQTVRDFVAYKQEKLRF